MIGLVIGCIDMVEGPEFGVPFQGFLVEKIKKSAFVGIRRV